MYLSGVSSSAITEQDFAGVSFDLSIVGTASSETLNGSHWGDLIQGLAGNDFIYGGAGDDTLDGGSGFDRLFGNDGADSFVLSPNSDLSIVYGFEDGVDQILVSGFDASDLTVVSVNGGQDTEIRTTDGSRMYLSNIDSALITVDDFEFV